MISMELVFKKNRNIESLIFVNQKYFEILKKNRITDNENVVLQIIVRCDHLVCRSEVTRELNEVAPTSQRLT